ncbi:choice-of-anchor A family protein [Alteromonas sp. 1_MG-2023]|uniref:choice-of-anchor A family protein n=1 Tax=Alteromonas sp. 1_MG-2023 TaxID=3062669 RepID=UPI0026E452E3|nr:choice-of-anchor A family protein [Alteromonas sp. 1_MG-2023]MDO6568217.1 choice-of-anchor A family protein [Alteromonas sp. 1_MG-2023]
MRNSNSSYKIKNSITGVTRAVALSFLATMPLHAAQITLSEAFDYNAFIFEDYTGYYSDVEGSLAVGGNVTVNDFDIGLQLSPDLTASSFYVGGDVSYTNGKIRNGETTVSGDIVANNVEFEDTVNAGGDISISETAVTNGDVNAGETFIAQNAEVNNGSVNATDISLINSQIENGNINAVDSISLTNSEVSAGSATAGNSISSDANSSISDDASIEAVSTVQVDNIDFAAIESEVKAQSSDFANMTVNGETTFYCQGATGCTDSSSIDGIVFSGEDDDINIFTIDAEWFSVGNKSITYDFSTTSYNIINVVGDAVSLFNTGFFNTAFDGQYLDNDQNADYRHDGTYTNNILFNFVDATEVTLESVGIKGSILAPYADVAFYNGHIDGNLIASSVYTPEVYLTDSQGVTYLAPTGQVNNYAFGITQVSAPGSVLMLLPALAMLFVRRKLQRKA